MMAHRLQSFASIARKTVLMFAVAAACAHTGRASAQSVSLVMEDARVQRECANIANSRSVPTRQPPVAVNLKRCREAVLAPQEEVEQAIAAAFALVVLAGCIYFCMKRRG